jgi:hypothetical protein
MNINHIVLIVAAVAVCVADSYNRPEDIPLQSLIQNEVITADLWTRARLSPEDFDVLRGKNSVVEVSDFELYRQFSKAVGENGVIDYDTLKNMIWEEHLDAVAGPDQTVDLAEWMAYRRFLAVQNDDEVVDSTLWSLAGMPANHFERVAGANGVVTLQEWMDYVREQRALTLARLETR